MRSLRIAIAMLLALAVQPAHAQLWLWSQTPTTNGNIDPSINWLEGMPPSAVDDSARATMAGVAKWRDDSSGLVALTGTSTAYVATTNQGNQSGNVSSLTPGYRTCFSPNVVNGASPTLQVDGQTVKPLRLAPATNLVGGELRIGTPYCATYFSSNGGEFILNEFYAPIIAGGSVTYAQIQNVNANRLLGNPTGSAASMSEIPLGQGLAFSLGSLIVPNLGITTGLINTGAVTYAKIQNETNATILGNDSGGAAPPSELTVGPGVSFTSSTNVGIGTGALSSGMYAAGSVNTAAIGAGQVTYAKIQNEAATTLLGNGTGSPAAPSEISLGAGLSFLTTTSLGIPTNGITTSMVTASAITYAKIQNEANATLLGNDSGGAAAPREISLDATMAFITATSLGVANAGINTTQLANSGVTYAKIQNEANATLLGNDQGSAHAPTEISLGTGLQFANSTTLSTNYFTPNVQTFTSGSSLTYTTPTNGGNRPLYLRVRMCAGGGGGAAATTNNGTAGNNSSFAGWTTAGGSGGIAGGGTNGGAGGTGGTNSTGTVLTRMAGNGGGASSSTSAGANVAGTGGAGFWGGAPAGVASGNNGNNATANSCAGGGGGAQAASTNAGGGGGAGEFVEFIITSPAATYTYTVGTGGGGGGAGGNSGGNGAAGYIEVLGFWQ